MNGKMRINGVAVDAKNVQIGIDHGYESDKTTLLYQQDPKTFITQVIDIEVKPMQEEIIRLMNESPRRILLLPSRPVYPYGVEFWIRQFKRRQRNKKGRWLIREMRRRYRIKRVELYGKMRAEFGKDSVDLTINGVTNTLVGGQS